MNRISSFFLSSLAVVVFTILSSGCGQGFKTSPVTKAASADAAGLSLSPDVSDSMRKAEEASVSAQLAMSEANRALLEVQDQNGNINLGLFIRSQAAFKTEAQSTLSPVLDKLRSVFDTVFAKASLVKQKFNEARQSLAEALSKLDLNDPGQARIADAIKKQSANIDALEVKFTQSMRMLASKLDLAMTGLDQIMAGAVSSVPGWGAIIGLAIDYLLMDDVRVFIQDLKARLLAL
jgi:hypothetical protein